MKKLKKIRIMVWSGIILGSIIFLCFKTTLVLISFFGLLLVVATLIYDGMYFKCPYCNKHLDLRTPITEFCSKCGKHIDD